MVDIATLAVLEGSLSPRVLGLAVEWAARHRGQLRKNWKLARDHAPLNRIEPLE